MVDLARLLSPAVFVEPELLRAMRRWFFPRSGPDLEGALWFSGLVDSHSPIGIALRRDVAAALRAQLGETWKRESQRPRLVQARELLERLHADISPALALEERIAWLAVVGDQAAIEAELSRALKAHATGQRPGVSAWAAQAWGRLPEQARASRTGWLFQQMARSSGAIPIAVGGAGSDGEEVGADDVSAVLGSLRDVTLAVRLGEHSVEIGDLEGEVPMGIEVPDTEPRIVDVVTTRGGSHERQRVAVPMGGKVEVARGNGVVSLVTIRGAVYEIGSALPPRFKSMPPATVLVVGRAEHLSDPEVECAKQIGAALARAGHSMIDGGFPGVDYLAGEAFAAALKGSEPDVGIEKRLTHIVSPDREPDFKPGARHIARGHEDSYAAGLMRADAVVLVGGTDGTRAIYRMARDADIPVFPVSASGGAARVVAEDIAERTGPGRANCDGLPVTTMDQSQRLHHLVRKYLASADPKGAAHVIASTAVPKNPPALTDEQKAGMHWIWTATNYNWVRTLDEANAVMGKYWDEMRQRAPAELHQERWRLRSRFAADRVLAYVCVQIVPVSTDVPLLVEAAAIERRLAAETRETRPLYQLLVSFQRILDEQALLPEQAPMLAQSLSEIRALLDARQDLDRGHQCQQLARHLLDRAHRKLGSPGDKSDPSGPPAESLTDLPETHLSDARAHQEAVLDASLRLLGDEHPDTLTARNNLAQTLFALDELSGARAHQEAVLEARRRVFGDEHPATLEARRNLAQTLYAQGDLGAARAHQEAVLDASLRFLGEEHPDTLTARSNLAQTLYALGDLGGARMHQEAALEVIRRLLGEEHPDTLTARSNLAQTLYALGDLGGARMHQEAALEVIRRLLGEDHPTTLTARLNLAQTLYAQGDMGGARGHQEAVLEARRRLLGEEHPDTLIARNDMARMV